MEKDKLRLEKIDNTKVLQTELIERIATSSFCENSTVNANIITTSYEKYDIIVKEDLNIEVVEHITLQGTWLFNDQITYTNDLYYVFDGIVSNTEYSYSFSNIKVDYILGHYYFAPFWTGGNPYHPYGFANIPENSLGISSGWVWINVNTYENIPTTGVKLTINCDISEVKDENGNEAGDKLLMWLHENAKKI